MSNAVIVDYGMGNLASIVNVGKAAGGRLSISSAPDELRAADKIILPGVGAFDRGMSNLRDRGLIDVLNDAVLNRGIPVLGICLGMQLFTRRSEEGTAAGLGWIAADTVRFNPAEAKGLRVPHMGWNNITVAAQDKVRAAMPDEPRFYFAHSYHVRCDSESDVLAWTDYGYRFPAMLRHGNIVGVQFHPEKSHKFGIALMRNFLASA
jgi:glutamine amidotransferase